MNSGQITAIVIVGLIILALAIVSMLNNNKSLDKIKSRTVGDGQFGNARWATQKELSETFEYVDYTPYLWRQGKNLPKESATVLSISGTGKHCKAMIDVSDSNTIMLSAPGGYKTTGFLYHNIEYCLASGVSFLCTDTKGDVYRDYALIAQKYYQYIPYIIDLRYPSKSNPRNILHSVNKHMDIYLKTNEVPYLAFSERAAKNVAYSIVNTKDFDGGGQNRFFYEAAEGLIASVVLLISELCKPSQRHIVSVFKLCQELLEFDPSTAKKDKDGKLIQSPVMYLKTAMNILPPEHKAKWLASSALNSSNQTLFSVVSTAMSRMLSFIDSDIEQILCFDTDIDGEDMANNKVAVFINFPEEDKSKHFLVSLIIRQFYDELLETAAKNNNHLPKRVYFYEDEFGTLPPLKDVEDMFSAGRSRGLLQVPMIQSFAQLEKNYHRTGEDIIKDCAQNAVIGWLSPLSKTNNDLAKILGTQTVTSGSVSNNNKGNSLTTNMTGKDLLSPQEVRAMQRGEYVLLKSGINPTRISISRYDKTKAMTLDEPFAMDEQAYRTVDYASRDEFMQLLRNKYSTPPAELDLQNTQVKAVDY